MSMSSTDMAVLIFYLVSHLSAALHSRRAGTIWTPAWGCSTLCSFCILSAAKLVAATSALSVEEELLVGLPETSRQTVQVGTVMGYWGHFRTLILSHLRTLPNGVTYAP